MDTIPTLYEEFDITFQLYINRERETSFRSILRLTNTVNANGNLGDRIANLEVKGDLSETALSSDSASPSTVTNSTAVPTETWMPIRIQQAVFDGRFKLMFWVDGKDFGELTMGMPQVYNDTKIYAGDSFKKNMYGTIKNLTISTGNSKLFK